MYWCVVTFPGRAGAMSLICCRDQSDGSWKWWWLCSPTFSLSHIPPSTPPPTPSNRTHLLVLAPLRPKCDLCPDKGRWKRDCQTGRVGSEPLWGLCAILSWRGRWMAFSHVKKGRESVWAALLSASLPTPGDSRRHGVTAVSGMFSGHWTTFPSPCRRLSVRILPVLSTVCN